MHRRVHGGGGSNVDKEKASQRCGAFFIGVLMAAFDPFLPLAGGWQLSTRC